MINPRFVIKAVISGQRLNINIPLTVAGTVNYIGVEAKCTSEWDDCTVVCYIKNAAGNMLQLALTYDKEKGIYYFPTSQRLSLIAGDWSIWFVGVTSYQGQETFRVVTEVRTFTVANNDLYSSVPQGDITLDEQAIAKATQALNTANLLLDLYNEGKLAGPKGDPGDPAEIGFVQASVDNTTGNPSCVVTVTEDPSNNYNMQFAFSGLKGAKGDKGDKGENGATGPQGAPGRDGTDGIDGQTIDDYVVVQENEPSSPTTKMWLKPTAGGQPVMIPTIEEFESALNQKAPMIYDTASGAVANFTDGADNLPLKKLVVNIEPVQSGTGDPSPQNVRPIIGRTKCYINDSSSDNIVVGTPANITFDANTGKIVPENKRLMYVNKVGELTKIFVYGAPFYFHINSGYQAILFSFSEDGTHIASSSWLGSSQLIANTGHAHYIYIVIRNVNNTVISPNANTGIGVYLNSGYIHAMPSGYQNVVSWQETAGTVYGGKLTINDDGTGELSVRPYYASYNGESLVGPWVSDRDVYATGATPTTGAQVVDMGGVETGYNITTDQITTLLGTNNIWADCGPVSVDYPADTKLYIQKINAPSDDDMTANTQIASGKYFIIGNNLYLSTTVIPAGDAIIPGNNCTKTNLAEALNALNT